ncbi:MAG: MFS transporter [Armatimonadota bacterium]
MLVESLIPWRARPNFQWDSTSAILSGIWVGGTIPFVAFIARKEFHASDTALGLMTAGPFVGSFLALPLTHALSKTSPIRNVTLLHIIARIVLLCSIFAHSSWAFAWSIFTVHCISAIPYPTYASVLRLIYPLDFIGRLLSYIRVLMACGMIASTFLAPFVVARIGWRGAFLVYFPVGLAACWAFSRIKIPQDQSTALEGSSADFISASLRLLKDDVAFRAFAVAVFVYGFGNLMTIPVYTIYQVDVLNIDTRWVAILTNTTLIIWVPSFIFWGQLADQIPPLKIVLICTVLAVVPPLNHVFATSVWMLLPMAVVSGIAQAGIELSYFNTLMHFSSPTNAAQYQGIHSLLLGVRGIAAPFVGAGMAHWLQATGHDVRWVFVVGGALVLIGAILQFYGLRYPPQGTLMQRVAGSG